MTGSHEVRGSIPLGSTNLAFLFASYFSKDVPTLKAFFRSIS